MQPEQSRTLLQAPDSHSLKGRRDRAILAVMLACGLRRSEVADLTMQHLQQREDHWVIADLIGKAAHIRSVPVPGWVKVEIDGWITAAEITSGPLFRCISRRGTIWGEGITEKVIWHVVKESAAKAGIAKLSPHDCRRYAECQTMPHGSAFTALGWCSATSDAA